MVPCWNQFFNFAFGVFFIFYSNKLFCRSRKKKRKVKGEASAEIVAIQSNRTDRFLQNPANVQRGRRMVQ